VWQYPLDKEATMARKEEAPARFDALHELLARSEALGLHVSVNVHGVPSEELLGWLQLGLLDAIEQGAGSNPPTGVMESGSHRAATGKAEANAFMEDDQERQRRIDRREDELIKAARAGLGLTDDQEGVA
jgi:hypothetical protein